jgi:serine/threonine protein kinase
VSEDVPQTTAGLAAGSRIAGYLLEEQIGQGGMAVVFRARDERLGRQVAVKVLAPALVSDAEFRQRFVRESRTAAAVDSPHIIPVFEAGEAGGVLYIAMRYVRGGDVRTLLDREGPLPAARAAEIISQAASALDAAHRHGLVHRDVKPANMLLDDTGSADRPDHVYLSDFGLTKQSLATSGLTGTGQFLGTVDYIAPEQIAGQPIDGRADEYSLACSAFELLTGTSPFHRPEAVTAIYAQLNEPPPPVTSLRPDLPPAADHVFARALAKAPESRYATCLDFADALRTSLRPSTWDGRSRDDRRRPPEPQLATIVPSAPSPLRVQQEGPTTREPVAGGRPPTAPSPAVGSMAPARRRRSRQVAAGIGIVAIAAAAALFALTHHSHGSSAAPPVPAPRLGRFVPAAQRVLRVEHFRLDPGQPALVAVTTTTGSPNASGTYANQNMLLLAWDHYAQRWTLVYDAAREKVNIFYDPDAPTNSYDASAITTPASLVSGGEGVSGIRLSEVRNQPHGAADLLVVANIVYGDGGGQNVGIIHYSGQVARVVWADSDDDGQAHVIGRAGHQQVAITSAWLTPADPQCCAARFYQVVVAASRQPAVGETYRVISDNRPWLGVIVKEQPQGSANSDAVVVSVVPGSPAAGILRPGDVLAGVTGSTVKSHGLGPAIFDQLAAYKPGQLVHLNIYRNGSPLQVVAVRLSTLANPKAISAGYNLVTLRGNVAEYML